MECISMKFLYKEIKEPNNGVYSPGNNLQFAERYWKLIQKFDGSTLSDAWNVIRQQTRFLGMTQGILEEIYRDQKTNYRPQERTNTFC
jgi:hypothetical protein